MSWVRDLQVGDSVYVVCNERRMTHYDGERRVEKVGRQYVTLDDGRRFDRDRRASHSGDWPAAKLWRSAAEWEQHVEATAELSRLRNALGYAAQPGVTAEVVRQAAALLRVEL